MPARPHPIDSFTILTFPDDSAGRSGEPPVVYSDSITGALYLDRPAEIDAYADVWSRLEKVTQDEAASLKTIAAIMKEYLR